MNIQPHPDDQALSGPNAPTIDCIFDLLRYLVTVWHRFGNTAVAFEGLSWGGSALNESDRKSKQIAVVEAEYEAFKKKVKAMRDAQNAYFRTRRGLSDCKRLEADVDVVIEGNPQKEMFGE